MTSSVCSRRALLQSAAALTVATSSVASRAADSRGADSCSDDAEILGQGDFRYRAQRYWGRLDRRQYPVQNCHGITEDGRGRIVLLTDDTHNNLIAYGKDGRFNAAWETRFPGAHGLEIINQHGEDRYWITDFVRSVVSVCTAEGKELRLIGPSAVAAKYPDLSKYHPTCTAILPDGDFYVADGYGSSFVHHFDPEGRYISSFGGAGPTPANLDTPHAVWIDNRSGRPQLLVCDRGNNELKWFSLKGELLRVVPLRGPGADTDSGPGPCNVAQFPASANHRFKDHLAIACLSGMVLILDAADRIVSVVGGMPPVYTGGQLQRLEVCNYVLQHPHDVYVDSAGALYVAQWWSSQTYPIKLEPVAWA